MADYTLEPEERHTGQDATLNFTTPDDGSGTTSYELRFSNVSWSRDTGTSDVQHDDNLKATKALTDIRFSGSFEYSGQNYEALNALLYGDNSLDTHERGEPARGTLVVKEEDPGSGDTFVFTFRNCVVTSNSRDVPASDVSSTTYDWEAEDMMVHRLSDGSQVKPGQPANAHNS